VGHTDVVRGCAITADGRRAVSGSSDGTVKFWDLSPKALEDSAERVQQQIQQNMANQRPKREGTPIMDSCCLRTLTGHVGTVNCVAVAQSPEGHTAIVSGSVDCTIKLWMPMAEPGMTGAEEGSLDPLKATFTGHTKPVLCVATTRDGQYAMSGSEDGTMRFWGLWNVSREVVQTIDTPYGASEVVEEVLTSCRGCMATLIGSEDQASMKPKAIVTGYSLFAAAERGYRKGDPLAIKSGGGGEGAFEAKAEDGDQGTSLAASFEQAALPASASASASASEVDQGLLDFIASNPGADERKDWVTNVKQLDEDELRDERVFNPAPFMTVSAAWKALSPEERQKWKDKAAALNRVEEERSQPPPIVQSCGFDPSGHKAVSGSSDHRVRLWNLFDVDQQGVKSLNVYCIAIFEAHEACVTGAVMGRGYAVTAGYDRMLALFDAEVESRNIAVTVKGKKQLAKKNFITAKNEANGPIWTSGPKNQTGFHASRILAMGASSNAKQVVTASADNRLKMWDVDTGVCVKTFEGCKAWVSSVAICGEISGADWTTLVDNGASKGKTPEIGRAMGKRPKQNTRVSLASYRAMTT